MANSKFNNKKKNLRVYPEPPNHTVEEVVFGNMGLIKRLVKKYFRVREARAYSYDDLVQAGILATIRAYHTYDPAKGSFSGWQWKWIQCVIVQQTILKNCRAVSLDGRHGRKLFKGFRQLERKYTLRNEELTNEKISKELKIPIKDVEKLIPIVNPSDLEIYADTECSDVTTSRQVYSEGRLEEEIDRKIFSEQVRNILSTFRPRNSAQKSILHKYLYTKDGKELNLRQLGAKHKVTKQRMHQHLKILKKDLRDHFEKNNFISDPHTCSVGIPL